MRILVDGGPMIRRTTGVGRYTRELLQAALARSDAHQYTAFGFALRHTAERPLSHPNFEYRHIRSIPSKVYNALLRDVGTAPPVDVLARARPELAFFPNYTVYPMRAQVPKVVVIYDLSYRRYPEMYTARSRRFLDLWVPRSIERADAVVAISEFTRNEILAEFPLDPEKVVVIPCGIDHSLFRPAPRAAVDDVLGRHGVDPGYVLSVGTLEPRKNLIGLVRAFGALPPDVKQRHPLVIVGGKGWRDSEIVRELDGLEAAGEPIRRLGYVADPDLPALYTGAALFAYPSFYEGFGLPVLEAMACGAPVVTSTTASLPEITGNAAVLADPTSQEAITSALAEILSSRSRAELLAAAGVRQALTYSWATSADLLLRLFDSLVPERSAGTVDDPDVDRLG